MISASSGEILAHVGDHLRFGRRESDVVATVENCRHVGVLERNLVDEDQYGRGALETRGQIFARGGGRSPPERLDAVFAQVLQHADEVIIPQQGGDIVENDRPIRVSAKHAVHLNGRLTGTEEMVRLAFEHLPGCTSP